MSDYVCTKCAAKTDDRTYGGLCALCHDLSVLTERNELREEAASLRAKLADAEKELASRRTQVKVLHEAALAAEKKLAEAESAAEGLRAALAPFAELPWPTIGRAEFPDSAVILDVVNCPTGLTLGDFRRARKALAGAPGEGQGGLSC